MWIRIGNSIYNTDKVQQIYTSGTTLCMSYNNENISTYEFDSEQDARNAISKIAHGLNTGEKLLILK